MDNQNDTQVNDVTAAPPAAAVQARLKRTRLLTRFSIILAIEAIFCFTPLGSIPIGPIVATLAVVPVVITGVLLGARAGGLMGFFAGLFSFVVWTFTPPSPMAFIFTPFYSVGGVHGNLWSLAICFVPRILVGAVAGGLYFILGRFFKAGKGRSVTLLVSGFFGSMTNTALVLAGIYIFFGHQYMDALGQAYSALLGFLALTFATNGLMEAAIAALAALFVGRAAMFFTRKNS